MFGRVTIMLGIGPHSSFLPAALHAAQETGIQFTQRPILSSFAPQARHVAPMGGEIWHGGDRSPPCQISPPSVQRQGCRTSYLIKMWNINALQKRIP